MNNVVTLIKLNLVKIILVLILAALAGYYMLGAKVYSVEYYLANKDARLSVIENCKQMGINKAQGDQNCKNALMAMQKVFFGTDKEKPKEPKTYRVHQPGLN